MSSFMPFGRKRLETAAAHAPAQGAAQAAPPAQPTSNAMQVFQNGGLTNQAPAPNATSSGTLAQPQQSQPQGVYQSMLAGKQGTGPANVAAAPSSATGAGMASAEGFQKSVDNAPQNELDQLYEGLMQKQEQGWSDTQGLVQAQNAAMQRRAMAMQGAMGTAVAGGFAGAFGGAFAAGQQNLVQARGQYNNARLGLMERIAFEKTRRSERQEDITHGQEAEERAYLQDLTPENALAKLKSGEITEEQFLGITGKSSSQQENDAKWNAAVVDKESFDQMLVKADIALFNTSENKGKYQALRDAMKKYYLETGVMPPSNVIVDMAHRAGLQTRREAAG